MNVGSGQGLDFLNCRSPLAKALFQYLSAFNKCIILHLANTLVVRIRAAHLRRISTLRREAPEVLQTSRQAAGNEG